MTTPTEKYAVLLHRSDYRVMEWKNGRGETAEIAIFPSTASFPEEPFVWRLSSARIKEAGPFSPFPGYSRYLLIVKGEGIKLQVGEAPKESFLRKGEAAQFSGEWPIFCEPLDQEVADLNLIFRSDQAKTNFNVIKISKKSRSFQLEGTTVFLFGISGMPEVSVYPGGEIFKLKEGETIRIDYPHHEDADPLLVLMEPGERECCVALIEISS